MNLSLPADLREWVAGQVEAGGFGTASEYMRDMLRRARERQQRRRIDAMLLEAVESGVRGVMDDRYWSKLRDTARRAAQADRRKRASR